MKELLYIILCWMISKVNSNIPNIVTLSLSNAASSYSIYCMQGNSNYFQRKAIDQMKDICWTDRENDIKDNGTFINSTDSGAIYENTLVFDSNLTLTHFPMLVSNLLFEKSAGYKRTALGLSFKFKNESQSIVHQLKSMGLIANLSYSLISNEDYTGSLFIGGIPNNVTHNKTRSECKVNPSNAEWSCPLSKVSLGGFDYNKQHDAYFQASEQFIRAPLDFMKFLVNTVLKDENNGKRCFYGNTDYNVYCERDVIDRLNIIEFTMGNYLYSFKASLLFERHSQAGFKIRLNLLSNSTWMIGVVFLDHFASLFDYDNGVVSLYLKNESNVLVLPVKSYQLIAVLLSMCIIILSISLIGLLYIKYFY